MATVKEDDAQVVLGLAAKGGERWRKKPPAKLDLRAFRILLHSFRCKVINLKMTIRMPVRHMLNLTSVS